MKKQGFTIYFCSLLFALSLACCLIACVRQDMSNCAQHSLSIKVIDAEGNDITNSGCVETVSAYLFGKSGFVRMISVGSFEISLLGSEAKEDYTIVAWGNLKDDTLSLPHVTPGMSMQESQLKLIRKENSYHLPTTDLFYCRKEIGSNALSRSTDDNTLTLVLERVTANISIRAKHLLRRFGSSNSDYQFIVHSTGESIDFRGQTSRGKTVFKPRSATNEGELYAPPFHILPTSNTETIEIDIVRNGNVLFTVTTDQDGIPLHALAGHLLRVEIDFLNGAEVEVSVSAVPWEEEIEQDTEM